MLRSHRRDAARARSGRNAADPVRQAGRRVSHARGRAARAARQFESGAEVGDLGALQRARSPRPDDVRPDDGRFVDLHRQPGHRAGHARDVRRNGPAPLRRQSQGQVDSHGRPRRHGRRAAARGDDGGREHAVHRMPAEPHPEAPRHGLPRRAGAVARCRAEDDRERAPRPAADLGRRARQCGASSFPSSFAAACVRMRSPIRLRRTISSTAICRWAGPSSNGMEMRTRDPAAVDGRCAALDRRARQSHARLSRSSACRCSTTATTSARSHSTKA